MLRYAGGFLVSLYTHVLSVSSTDVSASDELVTAAIQTMSSTSMSRLRTAEWMTVAQSCWTCRACMDGCRHHPHSHLHTAVRTSASALPPTFRAGDRSAKQKQHNVTWLVTWLFMLTKVCAYVHLHSCSITISYCSWCLKHWPVDVCCKPFRVWRYLVPTHRWEKNKCLILSTWKLITQIQHKEPPR